MQIFYVNSFYDESFDTVISEQIFYVKCPCLSAGQRSSKLPRREGRKIAKKEVKNVIQK